jgi:excisionase family DNA binding protein
MGKMIDTTEAAERLGVSTLRVQQLCRQRRIKGARLTGRVWMIPEYFVVTPGTRGPKPK